MTIIRNPKIRLRKFTDYFKGFEKVEAVKNIFGNDTTKVLDKLKVELAQKFNYLEKLNLE